MKEIITIEEYKEYQPDFELLNIPELSLQASINSTYKKLNAKCGGMIELVWDITDENDPNYRTEKEKCFIKDAMLLQTQVEVSYNNDPTGGQTSISATGVSYSETRNRELDTQILPMVFDLLVKARVYYEQIAVETRLSNENCDDFENLNPNDSKYEKDPITMSIADQRYIRKYQDPKLAGKVATIDTNGLVVWNEVKSGTEINVDGTTIVKDNKNVISVGEIDIEKVKDLQTNLDKKVDNLSTKETETIIGNNESKIILDGLNNHIDIKYDVFKVSGIGSGFHNELLLQDADTNVGFVVALKKNKGSKFYYLKKDDPTYDDKYEVARKEDLQNFLDKDLTTEQQIKGPIDFVERPKYQGTSLPIFNDLLNYLDKNEILDQDVQGLVNFNGGITVKGLPVELSSYLTIQQALLEFGRLGAQASNTWNSRNTFYNNVSFYAGNVVVNGDVGFQVSSSRSTWLGGYSSRIFGYSGQSTNNMEYTPTIDGTKPKEITNVEFVKAQVNNIGETISNEEAQKIITKGIKSSASLPNGDINISNDADLGNPELLVKGRRPIRTGQLIIRNWYNNTDNTRIGNKWYGSIFSEIPELNDSSKEVCLYFDLNMPPFLVTTKGTDQSYPIRFDNPGYTNVDSTLTIGLGNNNEGFEGRLDNGFRGYYQRSNLTYQWTQLSMYVQIVKGTGVGEDYIAITGCGVGRDNDVYANVPNAQGPTDFAAQQYVLNYKVYEKQRVF